MKREDLSCPQLPWFFCLLHPLTNCNSMKHPKKSSLHPFHPEQVEEGRERGSRGWRWGGEQQGRRAEKGEGKGKEKRKDGEVAAFQATVHGGGGEGVICYTDRVTLPPTVGWACNVS